MLIDTNGIDSLVDLDEEADALPWPLGQSRSARPYESLRATICEQSGIPVQSTTARMPRARLSRVFWQNLAKAT
jgi:hypothetical protein